MKLKNRHEKLKSTGFEILIQRRRNPVILTINIKGDRPKSSQFKTHTWVQSGLLLFSWLWPIITCWHSTGRITIRLNGWKSGYWRLSPFIWEVEIVIFRNLTLLWEQQLYISRFFLLNSVCHSFHFEAYTLERCWCAPQFSCLLSNGWQDSSFSGLYSEKRVLHSAFQWFNFTIIFWFGLRHHVKFPGEHTWSPGNELAAET